MTIVLVILKALTLILAIILVFLVNKAIKRILSTMADYYAGLVNHFIALEKDVTTQVNSVTTVIGSQQEEVVKLTNKVEESNSYCKAGVDSLKHTVLTLNDRLTSPIDKINDTHNRIKTLGKSAASTDELRKVVAEVVSSIATEAVDSVCQKCAPKPKVTKKVTKELDKELIKEAKA